METLSLVTLRMLNPMVGIMSSLNWPDCVRAARNPRGTGSTRHHVGRHGGQGAICSGGEGSRVYKRARAESWGHFLAGVAHNRRRRQDLPPGR